MSALVTAADVMSLISPGMPARSIRVPASLWAGLPDTTKRRFYELVVAEGLEVWAEGGEYVFDRPTFPPGNAAIHAKRHRWLLG